jgi:phospholipid transport system substrate-binding protein
MVFWRDLELVMMKRAVLSLLVALISLLGVAGQSGAETQTPRAVVQRLNDALLDAMKNAAQLGFQGRYDALAPVLEQTFTFSEMARVAVGQHWSQLGPSQRTELVAHFKRMSITTFAVRFDGYSGERFEVLGEKDVPQGRVVVLSRIVKASGEPVPLDYVFTETSSGWRAVDIYLQGTISELAIYRSEFASVLNREGYDGLIRRIEEKIARLRA